MKLIKKWLACVAKLSLKRTLNGWTEADDASKQTAKRFNVGEIYRAAIVKPRSHKSLARYWLLVEMILDNTDLFKSKEQLHLYLKLRAGHCTPITAKSSGEVFWIPDSIDYDTLSEDEFAEIWKRVTQVVCEDIIPGLQLPELELEIQKLMGLAR
jgi:hypothetical protein